MAVHRLSKVIQLVRSTTLPDEASVSDGHLLDQFIEHQDEFAFAALVRRHSPMVWGVCRRIVAHHQDAEDAFQATFLVLARKAISIRPRALVANWLFGVAQRTALKAKTMAAKRHTREKQVTTMPEPAAAGRGSWENLESLIDQELAKLPDKYRILIVLCDLEGKKGKDVARHLKIPEGTLASRLRAGRVLLAKRLARQGVALSGGALATALTQNAASASAPTMLVSSTIRAAILMEAGTTAVAGIVSANAASLMEGVMKSMLLMKLKTVLTVVLVVNVVAFGGGLLSHRMAFGQQTPSTGRDGEKSASQQAVPQKTETERILPPLPRKEPLPTKQEKDLRVNYPVIDLVSPIEGLDFDARSTKKEDRKTKEDWLIKKIVRTVAPTSWKDSGGAGTIKYNPPAMCLVVDNTPRVQAQVKHLLETMRRVQEVQVAIETRFIKLSAASLLKLQGLLPKLKNDSHALLTDVELVALIGQAQEDANTNVMQAPKATFFPGQRTHLSIGGGEEQPSIDVKLNALVAANLQHLDLDVKATVGNVNFTKALRIGDGETLAQFKRTGDGYLMLLVTPRVLLEADEVIYAPGAVSPKAAPSTDDKGTSKKEKQVPF